MAPRRPWLLVLAVYAALLAVPAVATAQDVISTIAGAPGVFGFRNDGGQALGAYFDGPQGVFATGGSGYVVTDSVNNRVRNVTANGVITTLAGSGGTGGGSGGFAGDGGPATSARLNIPGAASPLPGGGLVIADTMNNRIRQVDAGGTMTTLIGNGTPTYNGPQPPQNAQVNGPTSVVARPDGSIWFADPGNNRIRALISGTVQDKVGNGNPGFGGDTGDAAAAMLFSPSGIAFDAAGNLFIADTGNNRIRRVDANTNVITTVAGDGTATFNPAPSPATGTGLNVPVAVAPTSDGFLISDNNNHAIRKVAGGTMTTIAGNGSQGRGGDGGPATAAQLFGPVEIVRDGDSTIVVDSLNYAVRAIGPDADGDGQVERYENCPGAANRDQVDQDQDGAGDVCDPDRDGDGVPNGTDNCPGNANATQADADGDRIGDACDPAVTARPVSRPPASARPLFALTRGTVTLSRLRIATLGKINCPAAASCRVSAPSTVRVRIRGRRYTLAILGSGRIAAGRSVSLRVRFGKTAVTRLGTRTVKFSFRVSTLISGTTASRTVRASIKGRRP